MTTLQDNVKQLVDWLMESECTVAFTGAGISTESGIPDFRSPGGVWATSTPVYYQEFLAGYDARYEYWRQKSSTHEEFLKAKPNITHTTLAKWEEEKLLLGVITQNIDGLHQEAGSNNILELHGTAREVSCLDCKKRFDADPWVKQYLETDSVPDCPECSGMLKHATISFGQSLDEEVLTSAANWSQQSRLFIAMGSSLVVHPAAALPEIARQYGSRLVILNRDQTPLDGVADLVIHNPLGEIFTEVQKLTHD